MILQEKKLFQVMSLLVLAVVAGACGSVYAQSYPSKPIRIINPFSAGGPLDLVARLLARTMNTELGQPVIMDNRIGAGGNIGVELAAKSPPDGYTLLAIQSSITINPSLMKKVPYDPVKDFAPISKLTSYIFFLVMHPSAPVRSVRELIALARAKPDQLTYASVGVGSGTHLAGALFNSMAGIRMTHVPYKGSAQSVMDVVGGQIVMTFGSTAVLPHVTEKKLRLLGVTGSKRSEFVPEAPTIAESGIPGYEVTAWHALFAPAGTPAPIIDRVNALVRQTLAQPEAKSVMAAQGLEATPSTPDELGQLVKTELVKWARVIREANIKAE